MQLRDRHRPCLKTRLNVVQVHRKCFGGEDILETPLGQPALHGHLTALESKPSAMMTGAGLLTLDALA
jgi:hypothetical protein